MHKPLLAHPAVPGDGDATGQQVGGIAQRIASAISVGMLTVGERLPPEAELASQFGIAVATLRKALATLRAQGIVETRRGRNGGTFVVQAPFPTVETITSTLRNTSIVALRDIADEHSAVSGMAARLAAERTPPHFRTRLAELAFRAREARGPQDLSMGDSRFHVEVAVLSHSQRLLTAEQGLQAELGPFLWCEDVTRASSQLSFTEHLSLIMAIEQQRPDDAQRIAVDHVRTNIRMMAEGQLRIEARALNTAAVSC